MDNVSRTFRFCGVEMLRYPYDDDAAMRAYAWRHWYMRLTPLERRTCWTDVPITSELDGKGKRIYQMAEKRDGNVPDADVRAVFAGDRERFRETAIQRLLELHSREFNRCPSCNGVVRTPAAKLCPWCKHTWRNSPVA